MEKRLTLLMAVTLLLSTIFSFNAFAQKDSGQCDPSCCFGQNAAHGDKPDKYTISSEPITPDQTSTPSAIQAITPSSIQITTPEAIIYISGNYGGPKNHKPCYWVNGTRVDLPIPEGYIGDTSSIFVFKGVVYTAGYYYNESYEYTYCYWEGIKRFDLNENEIVDKICFFNGIRYMLGSYLDGAKDLWLPCYWVGNSRVNLPIPNGCTGQICSIDVYKGKVFAAGYYSTDYVEDLPCYWSGTRRIDLPIPKQYWGHANSICVHNGEVYTAGGCYNSFPNYARHTTCYWKGSRRIDLSDGDGEASKIFFKKEKFYILGINNNRLPLSDPEAWYWENGVKKYVQLPPFKFSPEDDCFTSGCCFYKGKFYASGYAYHMEEGLGSLIYTAPCYWEGSNRTEFPGYGGTSDIFIPKAN